MDRRMINVKIFEDTAKLCSENPRLQNCIAESNQRQTLYLTTTDLTGKAKNGIPAKVVVSGKRSFEAAATYARAGKKVCVLNFASATNPGGGVVKGSSAQEEALCRCSTLYFSLNIPQMMKRFYGPHRRMNNPLYNDDCLFTPGITVFKSDVSFPELMPEKDWYRVDVITCAAPNLRKHPSNAMNPDAGDCRVSLTHEELYNLLHSRIQKIFAIAAKQGAEVLILGAFGCGAFRNPPQVVAKVFSDVQADYLNTFDVIEYAVFHTDREKENFIAFKETLGK